MFGSLIVQVDDFYLKIFLGNSRKATTCTFHSPYKSPPWLSGTCRDGIAHAWIRGLWRARLSGRTRLIVGASCAIFQSNWFLQNFYLSLNVKFSSDVISKPSVLVEKASLWSSTHVYKVWHFSLSCTKSCFPSSVWGKTFSPWVQQAKSLMKRDILLSILLLVSIFHNVDTMNLLWRHN